MLSVCLQKANIFPAVLVSNTCMLLAAIISELAALATGTEVRFTEFILHVLNPMFPDCTEQS